MERKKSTVVDSGWSWVIACSCCLINCLLYGVARLSGLWMVSAVDEFQVNRATAALPFSVSTSVRNLSGLFAGYLGQQFGLRVVIATGCLLASLGAGLCFFVTDITWVTVCWGGIFGLGFGLATCLLPLAINQHFKVHRGTASGISYSGSYIGSFLLSPLVIQLLDEYGLSGTFLIISATFLNGFAASMLFHKPRLLFLKQPITDSFSKDISSLPILHQIKDLWLRLWGKIKSESCVLKSKKILTFSNISEVYTVDSPPIYIQTYPPVLNDKSNCELTSYKNFSQIRKSSHTSEKFQCKMEQKSINCNWTYIFKNKTKVRFKKKFTKFKKFLRKRGKKQYSLNTHISYLSLDNVEFVSYKNTALTVEKYSLSSILRDDANALRISQLPRVKNCLLLNIEPLCKSGAYMRYDWNRDQVDLRYHFENGGLLASSFDHEAKGIPNSVEKTHKSLNLLMRDAFKCLFGWSRLYTEPMFVVIAVTMSLHTFVIVCMITIIEDFAKDIRIPEYQVHYVLMVLSAADLVGSLTLGAVTDRGFLSRVNFLILCFFGMAICQLSISLVRSFAILLSLVAIYGLFESGIIITFPLLIAHFIPQKKQPTAVASSNILSSPSVLLVPLIIGYFRDRAGGCYRGVFYCLGVTSLCCSFIWLLVPKIFAKKKLACPN